MNATSSDNRSDPRSYESRLIAVLAHEINNPLEAILHLLYLLNTEPHLTAEGRHRLKLAEDEGRRISKITQSAMNAMLEAATLEQSDVAVLLDSVLDFYKSRFDLQRISIETRYRPPVSLPIYIGPLRRMFSNLLLNAYDAMPDGGRLRVRVAAVYDCGTRKRRGIRLTFADSGSGITAEDLPNIMKPFFTTKGPVGTGIGLAIVHDILEKHHGSLRVRSRMEKGRSGSIFAVFLPDNVLDLTPALPPAAVA